MSEENTADELRISIEVPADHELSTRVKAAIEELAAALQEADGDDEVAGFSMKPGSAFSLGYVTGGSDGGGRGGSPLKIGKMDPWLKNAGFSFSKVEFEY